MSLEKVGSKEVLDITHLPYDDELGISEDESNFQALPMPVKRQESMTLKSDFGTSKGILNEEPLVSNPNYYPSKTLPSQRSVAINDAKHQKSIKQILDILKTPDHEITNLELVEDKSIVSEEAVPSAQKEDTDPIDPTDSLAKFDSTNFNFNQGFLAQTLPMADIKLSEDSDENSLKIVKNSDKSGNSKTSENSENQTSDLSINFHTFIFICLIISVTVIICLALTFLNLTVKTYLYGNLIRYTVLMIVALGGLGIENVKRKIFLIRLVLMSMFIDLMILFCRVGFVTYDLYKTYHQIEELEEKAVKEGRFGLYAGICKVSKSKLLE